MKKEDKNINKEEKNSGNKLLKVLGKIIITLLIILIFAVGAITFYINNKLNKIQRININENDIAVTEGIKEELSSYKTIALLGIDSREDTYSKGNRSDCIILASIDDKTKEVRLVSVYRDTYLEITGRDLDKVTHAYSYGGPTLALSTLNTNLDLDMTQFVTVNFEAVKEIVNDVNGVEITITSEEVPMVPGITTAGTYNLTGDQALAYSRIRHATGGDYKRTERMRTVLGKVLEKAKKMSPAELNTLSDKILPRIYTNIESNEIASLIPNVASYKVIQSEGWPANTTGKTINGVWYGVPINLEKNVKILHKELFNDDNYQPSSKVKEISNKIINKTGYND